MENEKFEFEQEITEENEVLEEIISEFAEEPAQFQEETAAVRKGSPFADAPYEMNFTLEPQVQPEKPKKSKRAHTGRGKRVLAAVAALALGDRVSGEIDLGLGLCARVEYTDLCMVNPHLEAQHESREEIELHPGVPVLWNGWEIELDGADGIAFDADAIEGPVVVRSRRTGDRIALSGGHKSIKKLMIDRKIPAKSRDRIPLICDNNKVLLVGDIDYDRHAAGHHSKSVKIKCRRIML